jgi:hypothetical protein
MAIARFESVVSSDIFNEHRLNIFFMQSMNVHGHPVTQISMNVFAEWNDLLAQSRLLQTTKKHVSELIPKDYKDGGIMFYWLFHSFINKPIIVAHFEIGKLQKIRINIDKLRTAMAAANYKAEYHDFLSENICRDNTHTFKDKEYVIHLAKSVTGEIRSYIIGSPMTSSDLFRGFTRKIAKRFFYVDNPTQRYYWECDMMGDNQ